MEEGDIKRQDTFPKKRGYLGKKYRNVIAAAFIDRLTDVAAYEKRINPKAFDELSFGIRCGSLGVQVNDLYVTQLCCSFDEGIDKNVRCSRNAVDENTIAGSDRGDCVSSACILCHRLFSNVFIPNFGIGSDE